MDDLRPDRAGMRRAMSAFGRLSLVATTSLAAASVIAGVGWVVLYDGAAALTRTPRDVSAATTTPQPTVMSAETLTGTGSTVALVTPTTPEPVAAAPTPAPTPTASPGPEAPRLSMQQFRFGGRGYIGVTAAEEGMSFVAPFGGRIEVRRYQFIQNEVRVGSNIPSLPFFAYVTVVASDRRITFRPGALGADLQLLVSDGQRVTEGTPLFRLETMGRSSWATFYDGSVPYQVVVSMQALPSGRDLDPTELIATE